MITDRENILRMYHGEMPEFLPRFGMSNVRCSYFPNVKLPGYHVDEFGVEYIGKEGVIDGTPIPYPGRYILHDIRRWRDDVHIPSLAGIDWERLAKEDTKNVDRSKQAFSMYYGKTFQKLPDFMGFTEGLCAMMEEPDEVMALFDALTTRSSSRTCSITISPTPSASPTIPPPPGPPLSPGRCIRRWCCPSTSALPTWC